MRKNHILLLCSICLLCVYLTGCVTLYDKYIIYYVPSWDKYIRLNGAVKGEHKILISSSLSNLKRNEPETDFIVMSDSYLRGEYDFMIVNKVTPDTLFVMSTVYQSIAFPIKSIDRQSIDRHFSIDGPFFKIDEGYFGFYINRERWWKTKLESFPSNETGWVLIPVTRNCLWL